MSSSISCSVCGIHAERGEVEAAGLLVEKTQHHALAVARRDGRDAHVDRAAGDPQADAAVLRQALLGDVELRHDLDARDDERRHRALGLQNLTQHAVHAEAHDEAVLERLDVDVGRVLLHRLREHRVDEPDDRRVVVAVEQVRLLRQILREVGEVGAFIEAFDGLHGVLSRLRRLAQQGVELSFGDALQPQRAAQIAAHFGDRHRRDVLAAGAFRHAIDESLHEYAVTLREREGEPPLRRQLRG